MINVLLTSPDFIRLNSNISDNVNSKVLATAIREVQEDELQEILGTLLLEKLQDLIESGDIEETEYASYKAVLDKAQFFIMYKVIAELLVMVHSKIDNAGVLQTNDENMTNMTLDEVMTLKGHYDQKASHYAWLLQNYIMEHLSELPEVTEWQAWKVRSTLYSAASPSVFLGGARGRGWFREFPYRCQRGMNWPNK